MKYGRFINKTYLNFREIKYNCKETVFLESPCDPERQEGNHG